MSDLSKIKLNGTVYNFKDATARANQSIIYYGAVDSTSTSTAFTATIGGITEYTDGLTVILYNGVVTSAANFTIDINGLGALGSYNNMALGNSITPTAATRDTTIFNINYAMMFIYSSDIDGVPAWICYRGYDANTNTIGYQIRTNSYSLPMKSVVYRYRLLFQSDDHNGWVPANNSSSTSATSTKTVCQNPIDPFGLIVYYGTTASVASGSRPSVSNLWEQYTINLGYSFQKSTNYSLTSWKPVYIQCAPQSDGSAIIDSTEPIVQDLPSTEDGKIYIFLGVAYSTTSIELTINHPVYFYKNGAIRLWSNAYETEVVYPVTSVNGDTGAVTIDEIQTTAGENNVEYDLIGTAPANTNSGLVPLYKPTLATFAKTNDFARLTLGSTDTPGVLRIYSSTTNASGYTDLKTGSSSTNTRTITFPDATGTVALTGDIPSVSSWALAANKPSYTFSELTTTPTSLGGYGITDAYTKTEIDGMVSGVLHYKGTKATVSALPSSGNTTGDTWHVTADGSEWAWDGSDWQELGTAVDLSGYVPTSRTVNGKALTSDISLTASDVSALPSNTTYVSSFNGESGAITYTAPVTSVNGQTGAVTITDNDEKLKTTELDDHDKDCAVLLGLSNATASTKYYDSGIKYRNRDDEYTARLMLGVSGTGTERRTGQIAFYHRATYCILRKNDITKSGYYVNLPASGGTLALTSDIPTTASDVGALPSDTTYVSSINGQTGDVTLTIPAADDHKWNDVTLTKSVTTSTSDQFIPTLNGVSATSANLIKALSGATSAYSLAQRDGNGYIVAATPSANDSSTKVATTAFVGTAIAAITASDVGALADDSVAAGITSTDISNWNAKLSSYTETDPTVPAWAKASSKPTYTASEVGAVAKSGDTMTGGLSVGGSLPGTIQGATVQIGGGSIRLQATGEESYPSVVLSAAPGNALSVYNAKIINVSAPTDNTDAANKQYVDNKFSSISVPQPYNATTNPTGYLRITDLPIYDGTVV